MKYLRIFLLLLLIPKFLFAEVLEFPFDQANKTFFYLNKSILGKQGVSITPESDKLSENSKDYTLITFEKNNPDFHNIELTSDSKVEKYSGLFFNSSSYATVHFNQSLDSGFMIDFWAKPAATVKGKIFSMQFLTAEGIEKEIAIVLDRGKIKALFQNMFISSTEISRPQTITLFSENKILPETWAHHRITYIAHTGKITYYYNNEINSEVWATENGAPGSSVLSLDVPDKPRITLGGEYRGLLDQFIMSNDPNKKFELSPIGYDSSYIHTRVISLPERARINFLNLISNMPTDTGYAIEYRISDVPFDDNTPTEIVPWKEYNFLHPNKNLDIVGRYFQTKIHLFADPNKDFSPTIKKLLIHYTTFETPLRPIEVTATSSNGNLIVSLHQGVSKNISAYKIYLGVNPNTFLGDEINGVQSPILIPAENFTVNKAMKKLSYKISGLTPNKLYYLKITSVTTEGIESDFSEIVKTRIRNLE